MPGSALLNLSYRANTQFVGKDERRGPRNKPSAIVNPYNENQQGGGNGGGGGSRGGRGGSNRWDSGMYYYFKLNLCFNLNLWHILVSIAAPSCVPRVGQQRGATAILSPPTIPPMQARSN